MSCEVDSKCLFLQYIFQPTARKCPVLLKAHLFYVRFCTAATSYNAFVRKEYGSTCVFNMVLDCKEVSCLQSIRRVNRVWMSGLGDRQSFQVTSSTKSLTSTSARRHGIHYLKVSCRSHCLAGTYRKSNYGCCSGRWGSGCFLIGERKAKHTTGLEHSRPF
jgi:hypothetical protein